MRGQRWTSSTVLQPEMAVRLKVLRTDHSFDIKSTRDPL